jgi:hypothetical protein
MRASRHASQWYLYGVTYGILSVLCSVDGITDLEAVQVGGLSGKVKEAGF